MKGWGYIALLERGAVHGGMIMVTKCAHFLDRGPDHVSPSLSTTADSAPLVTPGTSLLLAFFDQSQSTKTALIVASGMGQSSVRYVDDLRASGANKDAKSSVGGGLCVR